jgi:hypothetical protein
MPAPIRNSLRIIFAPGTPKIDARLQPIAGLQFRQFGTITDNLVRTMSELRKTGGEVIYSAGAAFAVAMERARMLRITVARIVAY